MRGAPECSTQRCPASTPHVGQGTEHNCLGVSSLFFTLVECGNTQSRICTLLHNARPYSHKRHHGTSVFQAPPMTRIYRASIFRCPTAAFILFARRNLVAAITA